MPFDVDGAGLRAARARLLVFVVTVWKLGRTGASCPRRSATRGAAGRRRCFTYAYYGIALFGAAMTPYEVFFFSSGAVEERWTEKDLATNRANVFIGFPLGGLLSLPSWPAPTSCSPRRGIARRAALQVALPVASALGKVGLAVVLVGIFAATFGAALETALSAGYIVAQYLGWQWGKYVRPRQAPRFHLVVLLSIGARAWSVGLTGGRPGQGHRVLDRAVGRRPPAHVLPDPRHRQRPRLHGRRRPTAGSSTRRHRLPVMLVVVSIATIPLMIITKAGQ